MVDVKGYDIFGNTPQSLQKNVDCQCPNCDRTLAAQKFAPHLEKCMGMGRNSSRIANRKSVPLSPARPPSTGLQVTFTGVCCHRNTRTPVESDQEAGGGSEEEEDEWIYPERRAAKKARKEKVCPFTPHPSLW